MANPAGFPYFYMGLTGTLGYSGVGIEKVSKLKVVIVICPPASVNHKQNQTKPRSESQCLALGTHEHAVIAKLHKYSRNHAKSLGSQSHLYQRGPADFYC